MTYKFRVKPEDKESFILSENQLADLLLKMIDSNSSSENLKPLDDMIAHLNKAFINMDSDFFKASLNQLFSIYFLSGYCYKLFLNNNNIEIITEQQQEK
jgi:hypothetical protein